MHSICTPAARWKTIATQAKAAGYAYIYVTDQGCDPNHAYDGLPASWSTQARIL
jgi:hypothetical protein